MVQWLRLCTVTEGGVGSIPGWETKIPYATECGKKKKKSENITHSKISSLKIK